MTLTKVTYFLCNVAIAHEQNPRVKFALKNFLNTFRLQVHVSSASRVPDHCRAYALSYQGDTDYVSACDHEHDLICDRCYLLTNVIREIESALEDVEIPTDEKDETKYVVSLAKKRIEAWKAHLL